ncbi:MAG: hypothetical protein ABL902_03520 [Gallionella sp.]
MNKIISAMTLAILFTSSAVAAPSNHVGINYSFDNVVGTQLEFDIAKAASNKPVSIQLFWKSYQQRLNSNNTWNTTGIGIAGIYDLTSVVKVNKSVHPYVGLGLMSVSYTWAGFGTRQNYTGVDSGLYITGGVRYNFTPQVDADFNLNNFGGLTFGANFKF